MVDASSSYSIPFIVDNNVLSSYPSLLSNDTVTTQEIYPQQQIRIIQSDNDDDDDYDDGTSTSTSLKKRIIMNVDDDTTTTTHQIVERMIRSVKQQQQLEETEPKFPLTTTIPITPDQSIGNSNSSSNGSSSSSRKYDHHHYERNHHSLSIIDSTNTEEAEAVEVYFDVPSSSSYFFQQQQQPADDDDDDHTTTHAPNFIMDCSLSPYEDDRTTVHSSCSSPPPAISNHESSSTTVVRRADTAVNTTRIIQKMTTFDSSSACSTNNGGGGGGNIGGLRLLRPQMNALLDDDDVMLLRPPCCKETKSTLRKQQQRSSVRRRKSTSSSTSSSSIISETLATTPKVKRISSRKTPKQPPYFPSGPFHDCCLPFHNYTTNTNTTTTTTNTTMSTDMIPAVSTMHTGLCCWHNNELALTNTNTNTNNVTATTEWCDGWENVVALCDILEKKTKVEYSQNAYDPPSNNKRECNIQRQPPTTTACRRRPFDITIRQQRLNSLKRNMNPFLENETFVEKKQNAEEMDFHHHNNNNNKLHDSHFIHRNRSFNSFRGHKNQLSYSPRTKYRQQQRNADNIEIKMGDIIHEKDSTDELVSFFGCDTYRMRCSRIDQTKHYHSPAAIRKEYIKDCIQRGYDSDPEDYFRRNHNSKSHQHSVGGYDSPIKSSIVTNADPHQQPLDVHVDEWNDDNEKDEEKNNNSRVTEIVERFLNEKFLLVFHEDMKKMNNTINNKGRKKLSIAVHAWIDRGQLLHNKMILPKFSWLPVTSSSLQPNQNQQKQKQVNKKMQHHTIQHEVDDISTINLLAIARVLDVQTIDRNRYPFVQINKAFMIRTLETQYVFEARSEMERNRFTSSLKNVVSQFASKILLQDKSAVSEFFIPRNIGPGREPYWLRNEKKGSKIK